MPGRERTSPQYESFHELYKNNTTKELTQKAKSLKLTNYSKLNKKELVLAIMEAQMEKDGNYYMEGILDDIQQDGYGFLRTVNYSKGEKDIYISASQIRRFEIKRGDKVTGKVRKPKDNEKYYGLLPSFNTSLSGRKNPIRNAIYKLFHSYYGFSHTNRAWSTWSYSCTT